MTIPTRKKIYYLSIGAILCWAFGMAGYLIVFNAALKENRNHAQMLGAILQLERTGHSAVVTAHDPKVLLTKTFDDLETYLLDRGWQEVDQLGGTVFYRRMTKAQLSASCGMYSRFYMVCDLSANPF